MTLSRGSRPSQQPIIPMNPLEAAYLQQSGIYNKSENIFISELQMESAMRDLGALEQQESQWPTKEIRTKRTIQFALPGNPDLQTSETELVTRVPMTPEEKREYDLATYKQLLASASGEEKKPKSSKGKKAAKKEKV